MTTAILNIFNNKNATVVIYEYYDEIKRPAWKLGSVVGRCWNQLRSHSHYTLPTAHTQMTSNFSGEINPHKLQNSTDGFDKAQLACLFMLEFCQYI